jgi:outer membrane protein TolC
MGAFRSGVLGLVLAASPVAAQQASVTGRVIENGGSAGIPGVTAELSGRTPVLKGGTAAFRFESNRLEEAMPPVQSRSRRGGSPNRLDAALVAAALLAASALPVRSQQLQQVPPTVSLEEAIALGLRNSPQHLTTTNDVDVSRAAVRTAWMQLVPTVTLNASVGANYRETQTALDEFGQPLQQPRPLITKTSSSSQSINVGGITLFDGWRTWRNIDIAELNTEVARLGVENSANTLRASITRAYFQAVTAESRIELEEQLLQSARDRLYLVEQQFRIAAARQTDLLGAELAVSQQEQSLAAARASVSQQQLALMQAMGMRGGVGVQLTTAVPEVIDPSSIDDDALVGRATTSNPQIRQAVTTLDVREKDVANARAERLPTLNLGLPGYSWGEQRRGLFDAWDELGAPNRSFNIGLSASMPVFNRFQTSQQIQAAEAQEQDQRYTIQQQRLQLETDVRSGLIDLQQRYNDLVLQQRNADLAQLRLDLAQEEYRLGATTFTELQQIIDQHANAQRSVVDARLQVLLARVNLEQSIGGPL